MFSVIIIDFSFENQIKLLRLEQEEGPLRSETTQDFHKSDETKAVTNLKAKPATTNKSKKRKTSSGVQKSGSRQPQTCSVCAAVLSSRGALTKHMIIHQVFLLWKYPSVSL